MTKSDGEVIQNGYRWEFGYSRRHLTGSFPEDTVDDDLEFFKLRYCHNRQLQFSLPKLPEKRLISLVISMKFCDADDDNYELFKRWRIADLNGKSSHLVLRSKLMPSEHRGNRIWPKVVTIQKLERIVFAARSVCLKPKTRDLNPSSTSATKVGVKRSNKQPLHTDSKRFRTEDSVDAEGEHSRTAQVSPSPSVYESDDGKSPEGSAPNTSSFATTAAASTNDPSWHRVQRLTPNGIPVLLLLQHNAETISTAQLQNLPLRDQSASAVDHQFDTDSHVETEPVAKLNEVLATKSSGQIGKIIDKLGIRAVSIASLQSQLDAVSNKAEQLEKLVELRELKLNTKISELDQCKEELVKQQQLNAQNLTELSRQSMLIKEKTELGETLNGEINRQSIRIVELSEMRKILRFQLRKKAAKIGRLNGTIIQMLTDKVEKGSQIDGDVAELNLPPVYSGWTTDVVYLISSDNYIFLVSRTILSLKSPVFKADFSTEAAKKDGRVKTAFSSEVLQELFNFTYEQNFTANLPTVAVELYRAAEHYQLQVDKLKELVEEELVKQLSLETLSFTIGLAKQLKSDRLRKKIAEFVSLSM